MVIAVRARRSAGLALVTLLSAAACTSHHEDAPVPTGAYRLVAFDSCADALAGLRTATAAVVGPDGVPGTSTGGLAVPPAARRDAGAAGAAAADGATAAQKDPAAGQDPGYSGTTVQEQGVDEPDIVKTDGRRIITLSNGRLSIVDVSSRRLVGVVDLSGDGIGYDADLLITGDRALVLGNGYGYRGLVDVPLAKAGTALVDPASPVPDIQGASLVLVDLAAPRVLAHATADGSIVDARQVGSTVRIVTRSAPRLPTPATAGTGQERLAANRAAIEATGIDAWLPRLDVTTGGTTVRTQVGCDAISRPASSGYSGTNILTVLTVDASRDGLDDGQPVSMVADGDTVYSNGTSLYVASNGGAGSGPAGGVAVPVNPATEIYRFDTTSTPPRFTGGGVVPGRLINQYAMSEWEGHLRVATTTDSVVKPADGSVAPTQSGVYVLDTAGGQLRQVGAVEGLGTGEQIYAVRFVGAAGYVVTFRQTDPLYTVDLHDPTAPVVRGELTLTGYSAYLHPVGPTRLIGVGRDATAGGRTTGTQVSLFDVTDPSAPARLANYTLPGAYSQAEFDPHAFLYWPQGAGGLVVIPVQNPYADSGALVLRIDGNAIHELGFVAHPDTAGYADPAIARSLVTTDGGGHTTLWTVAPGGIMATDADTLARLAWLPF